MTTSDDRLAGFGDIVDTAEGRREALRGPCGVVFAEIIDAIAMVRRG